MGFFINESLNGMGMHHIDIPKTIYLKQMKVVDLPCTSTDQANILRPSG